MGTIVVADRNVTGHLIRLIRVDDHQTKINNLPRGVLIVKVSLQGESIFAHG